MEEVKRGQRGRGRPPLPPGQAAKNGLVLNLSDDDMFLLAQAVAKVHIPRAFYARNAVMEEVRRTLKGKGLALDHSQDRPRDPIQLIPPDGAVAVQALVNTGWNRNVAITAVRRIVKADPGILAAEIIAQAMRKGH